jgi:hypothetical protein
MLLPSIEIVITDVVTGKNLLITSVVSCSVESTWKALTDTSKITMPRNIRVLNGNINDIIKRGSAVSISMGYGGIMNQEFNGYVARLGAKIPFDIFCEDEMWQLKQTSGLTKTFGKTTLKEIVSYIYQGTAKVIDMELPSYRIDRCSAAKVLASLKEQYGIISYFQDQVLNVGFAYDFALKNEAVYHFQRNVPEEGVDLEFKLPEDYKVKVKGTSMQPGGKIIEYTLTDGGNEQYDPSGKKKFDGDEITIPFASGLTKAQLQRLVEDKIKKYKIGGYRGTLKAYGVPFSRHGDIAHFINRLYPENEGSYFIDKTTVQYGEGYRRIIEPGRLVN